jgi:2-iminobutanoate/2-iminopropanoate deaminase
MMPTLRPGRPHRAAAALLLASAAAGCASAGPARQAIAPEGATRLATYSPAMRSGGLVFLSGSIGLRPGTRELVAGGTAAETRQTLENIRETLRVACLAPADLVKCTVFMTDMGEYDVVNREYAAFFEGTDPPARSAVGVVALPLGARVEIECIAAARR